MTTCVVLSFDIGTVNFCWSKTRVNVDDIRRLRGKGDVLEALSLLGTVVELEKINMTKEDDKRIKKRLVITNEILLRFTRYLEGLKERGLFDDVTHFLIEEQRKNIMTAANNREIGAHLRSYLLFTVGGEKPVVIFPSKHKTTVLGAPKKMTYDQRKKWAVDKARKILTARGDTKTLENSSLLHKPDDICDTILQTEAFLHLAFIQEKNIWS